MEIKHIDSIVKIHFTREYGLFKYVKGNRDLSELKIKKIIKSIKSGNNLLKYCPIIVDSKMNIIDGQHRYMVCVQLKENVHYIITKDDTGLKEIADMNSNTDKWKNKDFVSCYSDLGKKDYSLLNDFLLKYKLPLSVSLQLLSAGGKALEAGGKLNEIFRNGNFTIVNLKFAQDIADKSLQFAPFCETYKSGSFIIAIVKLIAGGKYNHEEMIKKLTKHSLIIENQSSYKNYLVHLEELFNFKNQKRITLF